MQSYTTVRWMSLFHSVDSVVRLYGPLMRMLDAAIADLPKSVREARERANAGGVEADDGGGEEAGGGEAEVGDEGGGGNAEVAFAPHRTTPHCRTSMLFTLLHDSPRHKKLQPTRSW